MTKGNDSLSGNQLKQIKEVFNEGINELILPQFEHIDSELKKHTEILDDHTLRLDRIETRKQIDQGQLDNHDRRINRVEKHLELPRFN